MSEKKYILWFDELTIKDLPRVGGKNSSLGEMYQKLSSKGVRVPNGFATSAEAYRDFLKENGLDVAIKNILKGLDIKNIKEVIKRGSKIRQLILKAELSDELKSQILESYKELSKKYKTSNVDIAIRSSATAEDLPTASFAGQMESYLNISGQKQVLEITKECFASLFTNRAIVYRVDKGFDHLKVYLSACFQKMVRSDLACSGVMFSIDSESGFDDVTVINSSWGLGENIVQGKVTPDEFMVFDTTLDKGYRPIINQKLGSKEWKMIYDKSDKHSTLNLKTSELERNVFTLTDDEILELAKYSNIIEDHYKKSMDMEWAKDGRDGKLYILQARPETVQSQKNLDHLEKYEFDSKVKKGEPLVKGIAVGSKIASGDVNIILDAKDISKFKAGQILVTEMTDPDWVPIMKIAKAIVTNSGGRVCHAAIVSRELGIPCIVGTGDVTKVLKNKQNVTVSCGEGEEGFVYDKLIPFKIKKTNIKGLKRPQTKIMMNVGNPEQAFGFSFIPNDGVGLAREEFIINNDIGVHPLALLNYKKITDSGVKDKIDEAMRGYDDPVDFYVDKLAEGIGRLGASFYPKDVIV
ncbi:MAG: phosphoenolpyruvate synthase, partial [Patescibacteria group bacterium]